MILLTTVHNEQFVLNYEKILRMDQQADTIVKCTSGQTYRVKETVEDIISKVIKFKREILL